MKILLTGAFGNIGESTLLALKGREHEIRVFDIKTETNEAKHKQLSKDIQYEVRWGDITKPEPIRDAMDGIERVIHLAAIIPPPSESNPELAKRVNVGGMKNVIAAAQAVTPQPKIIFASSVSTYGPRGPQPPPVTIDTPQVPTDNYTHHKVECEKLLKESGLKWLILRLAAVPPLDAAGEMDPMIFETPFNQRIEFAHTRDVGLAFANAAELDMENHIFLIAAGKEGQMTYGEFINGMMVGMGIGELPEEAFKVPEKLEDYYYTDWMDTEESQQVLQYQRYTYQDFMEEMKKRMGVKRYLAKLFSGRARKQILDLSPYYTEEK